MNIFVFVLIAVSGVIAADNSTVIVQPSSTHLYTAEVTATPSQHSATRTSTSDAPTTASPSESSTTPVSTSVSPSSMHMSTHVMTSPTSSMMVQSSMSTHVSTSHSNSIMPTSASSHVPVTSMAPTTSLPPTTTPSPDVTFTVKDKNNQPCLTVIGDMKLMVTYIDVANVTVTKTLELVRGAYVNGTCSDLKFANETSTINMYWDNLLDVSIMFNGGDKWFLKDIMVTVHNKGKILNTTLDQLSAHNNFSVKSNGGLYQASFNHSYLCPFEKKLLLTSDSKTQYNITMDFKDITFQPFASVNGTSISGETCPAKSGDDSGSSIVPIAVGCALAGLIVIVLIAYLIGRRKGNNRGYQQV